MFKTKDHTKIFYGKTIDVICTKESKFPGIYTIQRVRPNNIYQISYNGISDNLICLWIGNKNQRHIQTLLTKSLVAKLNDTTYKVHYHNKKDSEITIGFLFNNKYNCNKKFLLSAFSFKQVKKKNTDIIPDQ